jgi:signal transduction histidine kinase
VTCLASQRSFPLTSALGTLQTGWAAPVSEETPETMNIAPVQRWRWLGARATLLVGFGVLLILLAAICADSLHTLGVFEVSDTRIRQEFLYRERTLEQIRSNLSESGNAMSEYLLIEADPDALQKLQAQTEIIHQQTAASLSACIQSLRPEKRSPFVDLATKLDQYWSTIESIFAIDSKEKPNLRNSLQTDLLSQHSEILAITKEISAVNEDELKEADQDVAQVFAQFRRRLLIAAVFAVGFGLIFAITTILYAARIEKHAQEKYEESLQAQRELKGLSRRLVEASEAERRAISRELHDEVGQSLSALLMDVERLKDVSGEEGALRRDLEKYPGARRKKCRGP